MMKKALSKGAMLVAFALVLSSLFFFSSCGSGKAQLRALAPVDTLVYLEVPDLGRLFQALTSSKEFKAAAPGASDLSVLNGIEAAIAVTGFEASESRVTDEKAVMNFKPRFTFIAETHLWSWQVRELVESTLGGFVNRSYGGEASLDKSTRGENEWYVWSSSDGRKAYAVVNGSRVLFGNNEDAIKQCLSVAEGKVPSLLSNDRLSRQYENANGKLVFGYAGEEGIKRLSDFAGISFALEGPGDADAQSVISSIFPQFIDNSVSELIWTAVQSKEGIRDEITVRLEPKLAEAFGEAFKPANSTDDELFRSVPANADSVTRYNLKDPRLAFRSLLIGAASKVNPTAARFVPAIGASLLVPYGVENPEGFLANAGPYFLTVRLDPDGDGGAAIVSAKDPAALKAFLAADLREGQSEESEGRTLVISKDGDLAAAFQNNVLILGDRESVLKCLRAGAGASKGSGNDIRFDPLFADLRRPEHTAVTIGRDDESTAEMVSLFENSKKAVTAPSFYRVETDFKAGSMRRTYISRFGFAGSLVTRFAEAP